MPVTTETATHVYIKQENPKGLLQTYTGPHPIVDRPSHSTIKVKMGTFKSGIENIQLHHWSNAKPAQLREDAVEAQMPVRGRKPKTIQETPEDEIKQVLKPQMLTSSKSSSEPANASSPSDVTSTTDGSETKRKGDGVNKLPVRRSERIQNKYHATSTAEVRLLTSSGPPTGKPFARQIQIENSTAPVPQAWSASASEIDTLNKLIIGA